MKGIEGKVALVAGGGSGLGRATSRRLAAEGASVVVADINEAAAKEVASEISDERGTAVSFAFDISDEEQVNAAVKFTVDSFGRVDYLHNVAADLLHTQQKDFDILSTEMADLDHQWATTLRGYILTCRGVLPHMIEQGGGAIVNTSSLGAAHAMRARLGYSIAKAGLLPLSQHIALTYGKQGIRCNTVAMGMIISPSFKRLPPERFEEIRAVHTVPDPGNPDKLAGAIVFLFSDDASDVTGQVINVDGGASVGGK